MIAKKVIRKFKFRTQFRVDKNGKTSLRLANSRSFPDAKKKLAGDKDDTAADTVSKGKRRMQGDKLRKR